MQIGEPIWGAIVGQVLSQGVVQGLAQAPSPRFYRVGAWMDDLPSARELDARLEVAALPDAAVRLARAAARRSRPAAGDDRRDYDAAQCEAWIADILALGLTDIVITANRGYRSPYEAKDLLADHDWRRLRFLVEAFTQHQYADGFPWSPSVHLMAFCGSDSPAFISDCASSLREACTHVANISSVMLDCEEWWVGGAHHIRPRSMRQRAADEVRAHLWNAWPRPRPRIGVTGIASKPPDELLEFLDYGVPQIYGSERNMGGLSLAAATSKHRDYYRSWHDALHVARPVGACQIIIGHTANDDFVDPARMRMLVHAALDIGGSGTPPLLYPETLFYWSIRHIRGARRNEVIRLAHLARNGGIDHSHVT